MAKLFNRVRVTTASTGTGTVTLGAAITKYQTFAAAGAANGDVASYAIEDGAAWEVGIGTYASAGPSLSRTLLASSTGSLLNLSGSAEVFSTALASDFTPPKTYLSGLTMANNVTDATNDIDTAAGEAVSDGTIPALMVLGTAMTKQLDATWAAGNNAGGLDTGVKANLTWYYRFLIGKLNGATDLLFSVSPTSPTMTAANAAGYVNKRRLKGAFFTGGTGIITPFKQMSRDRFVFVPAVYDNSFTVTTSRTNVQVTVPPNMLGKFRTFGSHASASNIVIQGANEPDAAPASASSPGIDMQAGTIGTSTLERWVDGSSQIYVRASASATTFRINTTEFADLE